MALFVRQDEQKSDLQNRLAAELQERSKERAKLADRPDGVTDSQYIKGTKTVNACCITFTFLKCMVKIIEIQRLINCPKMGISCNQNQIFGIEHSLTTSQVL